VGLSSNVFLKVTPVLEGDNNSNSGAFCAYNKSGIRKNKKYKPVVFFIVQKH
jgi:hypothetical protein